VDLILGLNGYIWVSKHVKESDQEGEEGFDAEAVYSNQNDVGIYMYLFGAEFDTCVFFQDIDSSTRSAISRVTNIIRVLSSHFVPLTDTLLLEAYEWSVEHEGDVKDLLQEDIGDALVATITTSS
jgi:exosome complex component RRP4